jgi:hypothetical protein
MVKLLLSDEVTITSGISEVPDACASLKRVVKQS